MKRIQDKTKDVAHDLGELEMDIDDKIDDFDKEMDNINVAIKKKAVENGITKESYLANY